MYLGADTCKRRSFYWKTEKISGASWRTWQTRANAFVKVLCNLIKFNLFALHFSNSRRKSVEGGRKAAQDQYKPRLLTCLRFLFPTLRISRNVPENENVPRLYLVWLRSASDKLRKLCLVDWWRKLNGYTVHASLSLAFSFSPLEPSFDVKHCRTSSDEVGTPWSHGLYLRVTLALPVANLSRMRSSFVWI
jgi:hypothetical protein